ncbi:hypothetical protein MRX96_020032 [Rhipicephalus microplus]|uniref:Putative licpodalin-4 1 n=1 Tax=Rhipicephalus microplus TaxID=6941 RepID=A0A6M2CX81_RHIMP
MFSGATFLCILVAVTAQSRRRDPNAYAEDYRNFPLQRLSAMTNQSKRIYVLMRDYNLSTPFDCHSAKKVHQYSDNEYEYELKARINWTKFYSYNVSMTAMKTGNHSEPNDAYYEEDKGAGKIDHKLMTTNYDRTCFVFAVNISSERFGCILAVTEDILDAQYRARTCKYVYRRYCGIQSIKLYKDNCRNTV